MDRRKVVEIAEGWDKLGLRLGLASGNNTVTESRVCARAQGTTVRRKL